MSKDLIKPMTAQDFLDLALPEDVQDERRSDILRHHGRGESGTNFFSPSTNSFITAIKSDVGVSLRFQTPGQDGQNGSHSVELLAVFEAPPQNDMPLPKVRLELSRVFSGHQLAPTEAHVFRVPHQAKPGLKQMFKNWIRPRYNDAPQEHTLTDARLRATLSIFHHAYRSISLKLEPQVPEDHPVFTAAEAPGNPALKLRSVTAAKLAPIRHRKHTA